MNIFKVILFSSLIILFSCKENDDYLGINGDVCFTPATFESTFAASSSNGATNSFVNGDIISATAVLDTVRAWNVEFLSTSGAKYTVNGESKVIDIQWDGSADNFPIFKSSDVITAILKLPCTKQTFVVSDFTTLTSDKVYSNLVAQIANFDGSQSANFFFFADPTNTYRTIASVTQSTDGIVPQGSTYMKLEGEVVQSFTYFIGGIGIEYLTDITNPVYAPLNNDIPLDQLYFNILVRGNGNPSARLEVQFKEDVEFVNDRDNDTEDETYIYKIYPNAYPNPGEWKLVSFRLSDMFQSTEFGFGDVHNDGVLDLTKIKRIQFNIINDTGEATNGLFAFDLDFATLTQGGPIEL